MTEATDKDSDDKRTAGDTELQRNRHSWDSKRNATEDDTDEDTDEDGGYVRRIKTLHRVAHELGDAVHVVLRTYYENLVAHLETVVAACEEVHALTRKTCNGYAVYRREVHLAECLTVH